jgi:hypothetical protein
MNKRIILLLILLIIIIGVLFILFNTSYNGNKSNIEEEEGLTFQTHSDAAELFFKLLEEGNPEAIGITVQRLKDQPDVKNVYVTDMGDIEIEYKNGLDASLMNRPEGAL